MRILFDKGVPVGLRRSLPGHSVTALHEVGWDDLENGELLKSAQNQYDVLITTDSNMKYQQRLSDYNSTRRGGLHLSRPEAGIEGSA